MSRRWFVIKYLLIFLMLFTPSVVAKGTEISIHVPWEVHRQELLRSAAEYTKLHPNVKINILGSGDVKAAVPVLLASNTIDAAVISMEYYASMVQQGFFQSIEPYMSKDPALSKQDFVPFLTELYSYNGQWYGTSHFPRHKRRWQA